MPVKDTARDASFAAMRAARNDIVRICREIDDDPEPDGRAQRAVERLGALLAQHGFEVESGVAGLQDAFRATKRNHDNEAMRNGLRHGHLAFLVDADPTSAAWHAEGTALGLAAALGAVIGISAGLESEFGTLTVIGYPGDASLVAMAHARVFDEFDVAIGARPAETGAGFCYTIDGTGETLATRSATVSVDGDVLAFSEAIAAVAATLERPNRIETSSAVAGVVELDLTGLTSTELRDISASIQRLVDETSGATVSFGNATDDTIVSRIVARRVKTYADTLGHAMDKIHKSEPGAASGWGSVSYATPTFLLNFPFTTDPVASGAPAFAAATARPESYDRAYAFAECLCLAGVDVLRDMQFRAIADDQLVKTLAKRGINRQHRRWLGVHPVIKDPAANGKNGKRGPKMSDFRMVRGPGMRDN